MSKSLLSIFKYLSERIHGDKCTDCRSYLYHMTVIDDQLIFRCFECKKIIRKTLIKN